MYAVIKLLLKPYDRTECKSFFLYLSIQSTERNAFAHSFAYFVCLSQCYSSWVFSSLFSLSHSHSTLNRCSKFNRERSFVYRTKCTKDKTSKVFQRISVFVCRNTYQKYKLELSYVNRYVNRFRSVFSSNTAEFVESFVLVVSLNNSLDGKNENVYFSWWKIPSKCFDIYQNRMMTFYIDNFPTKSTIIIDR